MKTLRNKLSITLIISTIAIFLITIIAINLISNMYILDEAYDAIITEASYYEDIDVEDELIYDENHLFDVNVVPNVDISSDEYNYLNYKEATIYDLYDANELNEDIPQRMSTDYGEFYAMFIEVNDSEIIDWFNEDYNLDNSNDSIVLIFYVDITAPINILSRLNLIFALALIFAVIIEGILGLYIGRQFEESQRKLKHFFEIASHELKTPLMSIQGYAEGIKEGIFSNNDMATEVIIRQSDKMKKLIDEILNLSKLESDEYKLKQEQVDITAIIEDSIASNKYLINEHNLTLQATCDPSLYALGDELQISKAINTLISNAVKYAVTTIGIQTNNNNKHIIITIINDGKNISDEELKHIFDRFYSSNMSSGIGLTMAKEIIERSKGTITVTNINNGVKFVVKLPVFK